MQMHNSAPHAADAARSVSSFLGVLTMAVHIGNVWGTKSTVIVILVSAPFPWSWVGDWGPKA